MPKRRRSHRAVREQHRHFHFKGGMVLLGLLVLANAYWSVMSWDYFIGIILVLAGFCKMLMHFKYK
jgi:uncharacterized membrane protein HdeD (DUF308 family)